MQSQSQGLQKSLDLNPPIGQFSFVIGKQNEIVAIPDIGRTPQDILNEVIERIQHDVPEELARLISDGEATTTFNGREKVITRKDSVHGNLRV